MNPQLAIDISNVELVDYDDEDFIEAVILFTVKMPTISSLFKAEISVRRNFLDDFFLNPSDSEDLEDGVTLDVLDGIVTLSSENNVSSIKFPLPLWRSILPEIKRLLSKSYPDI